MGNEKRLLVITRKTVAHYRSIREAERALGISHQRIQRALSSDDGYIRGTHPPICVDEELDDKEDWFDG